MTSDVPSSSPSPWRSMHAAPKDGSPVLGLFKQTFASPHNDRAVEQWGGTQIVMRHPGLTNESYDCGWNLINGGTGGFPDDWFEGWMPLPVTSASAASSTGALREALSAARGNLEEIEVNALDVGTSNMAQSAIMEIDAALTASPAPSTEGLREALKKTLEAYALSIKLLGGNQFAVDTDPVIVAARTALSRCNGSRNA